MTGQKRNFVYDNLEMISRLSREFINGTSSYTDEEKRMIVSYYLSNKYRVKTICERFNICSKTFYNWISNFAANFSMKPKTKARYNSECCLSPSIGRLLEKDLDI